MKFPFRPPRFVVLGLLLGLMAGQLSAQSLPRLLEDIKVSEVDGQETVRFSFSESYDGIPLEEHGPGTLSLSFSGTGSSTPVRNFRVRDSRIFRDIRVVQNKYSTTVSFNLKDSKATLKGRLEFDREKNTLRMRISPTPAGQVARSTGSAAGENLLSQMSKTIAGTSAAAGPGAENDSPLPPAPIAAEADAQPLGLYEGVGWLGTISLLGVSLAAIVAGLYMVLYLYRRIFGARLAGSSEGYPIKLLSTFHIGPKQRVVVLDINGEVVACGVTANQISLITRLGGAGQTQRKTSAGRPNRPLPAGGTRAAAGASANPATQSKPTRLDPVQQFAETLKEKVGSMKRIK